MTGQELDGQTDCLFLPVIVQVFATMQLLHRRRGCSEDGEDKHRRTEADGGLPEGGSIPSGAYSKKSFICLYGKHSSAKTLRQHGGPEETLIESNLFIAHA